MVEMWQPNATLNGAALLIVLFLNLALIVLLSEPCWTPSIQAGCARTTPVGSGSHGSSSGGTLAAVASTMEWSFRMHTYSEEHTLMHTSAESFKLPLYLEDLFIAYFIPGQVRQHDDQRRAVVAGREQRLPVP